MMIIEEKNGDSRPTVSLNRIKVFLSALPILSFFYLLSNLVLNFDRSLDITDESFYLLYAVSPSGVKASVTQFGYYIGILHSIVDGDVYHFRLLGLFVLLSVAAIYAIVQEFVFARVLDFQDGWLSRLGRISTILLAALCYYFWWLPTPSYYWLSLVSCLLAYSGLLLALLPCYPLAGMSSLWGRYHALGGLMFGVGVGLAFMAKPTTAVVLAVISVFWVLLTRLRSFAFPFTVVVCVASALFLSFHLLFFEDGFSSFIYKILNGRDQGYLLGAGHDVRVLLPRALEELTRIPSRIYQLYGMGWLVLPVSFVMISIIPNTFRMRAKEVTTLSIFVFIWVGGWRADFWDGGVNSGRLLGMGGIVLVFMVIIAMTLIFVRGANNLKLCKIYLLRALLIVVFLSLGPFAYAFGTASGLMDVASGAFVFFVSASIGLSLLAYKIDSRSLIPHVFCCMVAMSVLLVFQGAVTKPYRAAPISKQVEKVIVGQDGSVIYVDSKTSKYINGLKVAASSFGWIVGTPLIDLTGGSPGAAFILGATTPGTPWLLGGYPGSEAFTTTALGYVTKDVINRAWVLTAPEGSRRISGTVLRNLGVLFPEGYECIGEFVSPIRGESQLLYRPIFPN